MENAKSKIIVISGPTASGKSDVAIRLAKAFNGEIISADSRQIYRGLNIGSGKVAPDLTSPAGGHPSLNKEGSGEVLFLSSGIPHHLIDVADPMEDFNVSHFKKLAEKAVADILSRKKIPIICGGTGFWIDSLIYDTALPEVAPDEVLRNMLRNKSAEELFEQLEKLDPERAATIEIQNPVRLIRAIEIATALGKVPAKSSVISNVSSEYTVLQIAIDMPKEVLQAKIKKRLDERFEGGMIEEVETLHKSGVSWEWLERIGLEYRWISRFLQNNVELEEMKKLLYFDIIHYAKRQLTWFRRSKSIVWLSDYNEIENVVRKFLA